MKITAIKQQVKRSDRYSLFVDDKYSFSLSESALLDAKIASEQELDEAKIEAYKQLSSDDKLYNQALRYVAMRSRTVGEVRTYLERKQAPAPLIESIVKKLLAIHLLDDTAFVESYIRDQLQLKAASKRKIKMSLQKKHVASEVIDAALADSAVNDHQAIEQVIIKKRRQLKYQDDQKLMQYLARQGFNYDDIKTALTQSSLD